jgi:hypothetical protein
MRLCAAAAVFHFHDDPAGGAASGRPAAAAPADKLLAFCAWESECGCNGFRRKNRMKSSISGDC